ncbi:MAG: hypothetical protein QUS33_01195 [Dehalococcoidia bacterium]|nr:hypothetical protein [Dehalococcoidia bacterium]
MADGARSSKVQDFWSLIDRLYRNRDAILECSHRITDYAFQVEAFDTEANRKTKSFDDREVKRIFCEVEKEVNSILSYSRELEPHLKHPAAASAIGEMAHLLLLQVSAIPKDLLVFKLREIALSMRVLAQASTKLALNPTKRSIEGALGIRVGRSDWAEISASLKGGQSNF